MANKGKTVPHKGRPFPAKSKNSLSVRAGAGKSLWTLSTPEIKISLQTFSSLMKHSLRPTKVLQFALLFMLFAWAGCQKDRELTEQNVPTEPNYPITIQEAILRFSEIGISNTQSFNDSAAGRPFVDMEPQWGNAFLSHSTSGREIVIVPLPDSSLRTLNDGRVGAKLIFFKKGIDSVDVSILLYAADSSYFAAKHGQLDFEDFTGMYAFFDVKYNFSHGLFMDSGEPIVAVDSVFSGEHSVGGSLDRQDCITKLLSITYDCSVAFDGAQYCTEYFTTTECGRTIGLGGSGTGGTGTGSGTGGGGGTTGNNNSNNGNNNGGTYTPPLTNVYNVFNGSVPVDVFLANGGTLPSGFSTETVQQFIQIRNHGVNFNSAQLQWMLDHPTFIPVIHSILFGPQQGEESSMVEPVLDFAMEHYSSMNTTQYEYLVYHPQVFNQLNNYANANSGQAGPVIYQHLSLMYSNPVFYQSNANNNFPEIGSMEWTNTLVHTEFPEVEPGFGDLTPAERLLAINHPWEAYVIYQNTSVAFAKTLEKMGEHNGDHNGLADAFRHAFFQAINTQEIGATLCKAFSDAHESEVLLPDFQLEKDMDLFNNQVGINYGVQYPNKSEAEMATFIHDVVLFDGELKYLSPLDFGNYPHGIIPGITQLKWTDQ